MANMLSLDEKSPVEMQHHLGKALSLLRLKRKLTRKTLESMTGVPAISIKRFELEGEISLKSLLRLAQALDLLKNFESVLTSSAESITLEELKRLSKAPKVRKRGSR